MNNCRKNKAGMEHCKMTVVPPLQGKDILFPRGENLSAVTAKGTM